MTENAVNKVKLVISSNKLYHLCKIYTLYRVKLIYMYVLHEEALSSTIYTTCRQYIGLSLCIPVKHSTII